MFLMYFITGFLLEWVSHPVSESAYKSVTIDYSIAIQLSFVVLISFFFYFFFDLFNNITSVYMEQKET